MFDVFVSYRHVDVEQVRLLRQALSAAGLKVWLDECDIEDFASIQRSIEQGLDRSKALLAWYSSLYPDSLACQWELTRAFIVGQSEGDPRQRVLLINPQPDNEHIHPVELRDALYRCAPKDAAALASAARAIAGQVERLTGTFGEIQQRPRPTWFGAAAGDGSNRFYGRLREMWAIHSALWRADLPIISNDQSRPLIFLTGIGGSGKSLTAEVYGIRFGSAYPGGVFWLRAFGQDAQAGLSAEERTALCAGQLIDFAQMQGIDTGNMSSAQVREALADELGRRAPYLWVVDDLPAALEWNEVLPWLAPSSNGRTLITSRCEAFDWAGSQVKIEDMDQSSALSLLTHACKPATAPERDAANGLARDLGYHALALELAAVGVCSRGFEGFRESLDSASRDVMDFAAELLQTRGQALPHREKADLNLSKTLLLSVDALSETAKDFLRLAAQLAPVRITRQLVMQTLASADGLDTAVAEDTADLAMAAVAAQSLARVPEPGSLLVHTLVARAVRFRDGNSKRSARLRNTALGVLENMLGNDIFDVRHHAPLGDSIAHARALLGSTLANAGKAEIAEARLLDALYIYDFARGDYTDARRIAETLIAYATRQLGAEHPHTLIFMSYLGQVQRAVGDLTASLATHERVLAVRRRTLGEEDPNTITSVSNIALVLYAQGEVDRARQLQERVLAQRRGILGAQHRDTLTAMNNLAITLHSQGCLQEARGLQEQVVAGRREILGQQHQETLAALGNLAVILRDQGDPAAGREIEESVVRSAATDVGESHPDNLTAMNNLAVSLHAEGDLPRARELMEKVLALRVGQLGETHLDTLASLNSLVAIMLGQGETTAALPRAEQALALCREALGREHPHTLRAGYHLLLLLSKTPDSWDRICTMVEQDLAPLIVRREQELPAELRPMRAFVATLAAVGKARQLSPKPWWRRLLRR